MNEPPKPHQLLAVIRRLASIGAVRFAFHAEHERMEERDFDADDVLETLKKGMIKGEIEAGKYPGEWKCKVVDQPFGTKRWMGVVTIVVRDRHLFIKTTEWEDFK